MARRAGWLAAAVLAVGCGGSDEGGGADGGDSSSSDAAAVDGGGPTIEDRIAAAESAAASDPECAEIAPFFWEIGDAEGSLGAASIGDDYTASSLMEIASGSKWVWGAYVVERFADDPGAIDVEAMTMRSGYTSFTTCGGALTVQGCFQAGDNSTHTPADDGFFSYGGGHYQKLAVDLDLGTRGNPALATEIEDVLGNGIELAFAVPQPAGGMRMTPSQYARFLRAILAGDLAIAEQLGGEAVCTLPSGCEMSHYSPAPYAWHYSYGHWVEDEPDSGDGSFSSPGAFGFYPWIDASKTWYGIVARRSMAAGAYLESVDCGRAIRRAFMTGVAD